MSWICTKCGTSGPKAPSSWDCCQVAEFRASIAKLEAELEISRRKEADAYHRGCRDSAREILRLQTELAKGSIVCADGVTYTLQERHDCNSALLRARTQAMYGALERVKVLEDACAWVHDTCDGTIELDGTDRRRIVAEMLRVLHPVKP